MHCSGYELFVISAYCIPFEVSSGSDKKNSTDEHTERNTDRYNQQYTYTYIHTYRTTNFDL